MLWKGGGGAVDERAGVELLAGVAARQARLDTTETELVEWVYRGPEGDDCVVLRAAPGHAVRHDVLGDAVLVRTGGTRGYVFVQTPDAEGETEWGAQHVQLA